MSKSAGQLIVISALLITFGCGESSQLMGAKFYSIQSCLVAMPTARMSGQKIKTIMTDKPHKVTGILANGEYFGCEREESGTRGIYYQGWFYEKPATKS